MGGKVAVAVFPACVRVRSGRAVFFRRELTDAGATFAFFDDGLADAALVRATAFGHERAITAISNCCTNHWIYSPYHRFWPVGRLMVFQEIKIKPSIYKELIPICQIEI